MVKPFKLLKPAENIIAANLNSLGLNTKTSPVKLTISVTNRCNKECITCGIWKIYCDGETPDSELSLKDYDNLFKDLNGNGLIYIEFTGGEPFLRDDLSKIVKSAFEHISTLQFAAITTNGYNAEEITEKTRELVQIIPPECSIVLGVSIDGDEALHDKIKGVKESWKNSVETLENLYELKKEYPNLRPHVSYTINTHNMGLLEESYRSLNERIPVPMDDLSFSIEHNGLLYNNSDHVEFDLEKIQKDLDFLKSNPRRTASLDPVALFRTKSYDSYINGIIPFIQGEKQLRCAALKLSGYVDPYGEVFPCIMWDKSLGNVKETSFNELWNTEDSDETRKMIDGKICPICWTPCEVQPSLLVNLRKLVFS